MKFWITWAAGWLLALPLQAAELAEVAPPPDLPGAEEARAALEQDPSVARARHALEAAEHAGRKLAASPHDWTATVNTQRRRYDAGGDSNEWSAHIGRAIRIGGKAGIDRNLGETGVRLARAELGEARHEAARALADHWIDWLVAVQARDLAREQLSFAEANAKAVGTRRRAGDASVLELNAAQADVSEVQRQADAAQAQEEKARLRLRLRFPAVPAVARPLGDPLPIEQDDAALKERVLAESDTLRIAQEAVKRAELSADRARADRMPDPTIGVFTASEARRSERIVGVSVSIPFGGTYRQEGMREALKHADVARADLERQRREVELSLAETLSDARSALQRWRLAEQAAQRARDNARLGQRAYQLGEGDLQALLLLRRQSVDSANAALVARADALRARHRLLIDAHLIWGLADD